MNRLPWMLLTLAVGCATSRSTAGTEPERLPVKLSRAVAPGAHLEWAITMDEIDSSELHRGNEVQTPPARELKVDLVGLVGVIAVDPRGQPAHFTFTVSRFEVDDGSDPRALAPPGQVLDVVRGTATEAPRLTVEGAPVAAEVGRLLISALDLSWSAASDDDVFGTPQPRAVGESWPLNAAVAEKAFRDERHVVTTLSGSTAVVSRSPIEGHDCLNFKGEMKGTVVEMPPGTLPPGASLRSCSIRAEFGATCPIDLALGCLDGESTFVMDTTVDVGDRLVATRSERHVSRSVRTR